MRSDPRRDEREQACDQVWAKRGEHRRLLRHDQGRHAPASAEPPTIHDRVGRIGRPRPELRTCDARLRSRAMPAALRRRSTLLCAAGLILAAAGIGLVWAARGQAPPAVPVRIGVLLGVATIVGRRARGAGCRRSAWSSLRGPAWGSSAAAARPRSSEREGLGIAFGRWLQAAGLLIAAGAAVRALIEARDTDVAMAAPTEQPPGHVAAPAPAARRLPEPEPVAASAPRRAAPGPRARLRGVSRRGL